MIVTQEQVTEFIRHMRKMHHGFGGWVQGVTVDKDVYEALKIKCAAQNALLGSDVIPGDGSITLCRIPINKAG